MVESLEVVAERERRLGLWRNLQASGAPVHSPSLLNEQRIFYGGRGIWVHQERTKGLGGSASGVTVSLLHTGSSYADDLSDDGVIYHYPRTKVPGRDQSEVEATKAAMRLGLPVFVVSYPTPGAAARKVHLGWVRSYDDAEGWFLVTFGDALESTAEQIAEETPFIPVVLKLRRQQLTKARTGQPRFKFRVFQRYGGQCVACGLAVQEMLEAAHIIPVEQGGTDDPRNGLVLCCNHHRAFDQGLLLIHPETLQFETSRYSIEVLQVSRSSLMSLPNQPHSEALRLRWQMQRESAHEQRTVKPESCSGGLEVEAVI
jgi:putative restriction endonuclease